MTTSATLPTVQRPQTPTYNHPCGDLFQGGRRKEYHDIVVPLYRASIKGDWEAMWVILDGREYLVRYGITENKETPLHVAIMSKNIKCVQHLVNKMTHDDMTLENGDGNTAFCLAAIAGNVKMVEILFDKNQNLPTICGSGGMMPLYLAAFHGKGNMVSYLYNKSRQMRDDGWTLDNRSSVLLKCVQAELFDVAVRILQEHEDLPQDKHAWDLLQVLAKKTNDIQQHPTHRIFNSIFRLEGVGVKVKLFLRLLWKRIIEKPKDDIDDILRGPKSVEETYPCGILFMAAEMGNVDFLVDLIREYPDLIWKRNDDRQTMFHIAVLNRRRNLYNLLYQMGSMKDMITSLTDLDGNNMLHLVCMNVQKYLYNDSMTAPIRMQHELLWYKEVRSAIPPICREMKNAAGQTPHELFIENHKDLLCECKKWVHETTSQFIVVAALICTMAFAAAFTIPGGYDQNNGYPMFQQNKAFSFFVLLDAISFILSSISILMFLSVIASRHAQDDFRESLPLKMMVGLGALSLSILTLLIAFSLSFFVLYHNKLPIVICVLAILPTYMFSVVFAHVFIQTFNPTFSFRPQRYRLYYKNPKF